MADVQIDAAAHTSLYAIAARGGTFWTSPTVGYVIFVDTDNDLVYRKTADGGATWAAKNVLVAGTVLSYDCWADWQTVGDPGTVIHIACIDADSDEVLYVSLDTSDDSEVIDTIEACQGTGAFKTTVARNYNNISITKARGGNLAVSFLYRDTNAVATYFYGFYTSPDATTWTSRTNPREINLDHCLLFPGNEADNQDLWAAYWDASANEVSLKTFDNSGNSWSEQLISAAMTEHSAFLQMDGAIRLSDGHLIFAAWNDYDVATADLKVWDINGAASITAKTDVLTNSAESFVVSVFVNQANDDIYAAYAKGTAVVSEVAVFYKKSVDGGANWGGQTAMQADAEDDEKWISCGAVKVASGGKFQPVWFNDDLLDLFTNTANGISIPAVTTAYKDIPTRFKLIAQGFRDVATRFSVQVRGYLDVATRFRLIVQGFQDAATRFFLNVRDYVDIATRFLLHARDYVDVATRFLLEVRDYVDVATRFLLEVRGYVDIPTRFRLIAQSFTDIPTRFRLTVRGYVDIATRFRLIAQSFTDIPTRFRLTVQAFVDIATRFRLIVQSFTDIPTRFRLIVSGYVDVATRFRLNITAHGDAATRFFLYVPTWKELQIQAEIAAIEVRIDALGLRRVHIRV